MLNIEDCHMVSETSDSRLCLQTWVLAEGGEEPYDLGSLLGPLVFENSHLFWSQETRTLNTDAASNLDVGHTEIQTGNYH